MANLRRVNRCLTATLIFSFLCLITIFFTNPPSNIDDGRPYDFSVLNGSNRGMSSENNNSQTSINYDNFTQWKNLFQPPPEFVDVVESIQFLNFHHEILNEHLFGSVQTSKYVIAIQVHNRYEYLKYLIESFRNTKGIADALLIFSHDLSNETINDAIRNIDFCRVIQIFYPYNIQIFANTFPGADPNDCPASASVTEAKSMHCSNADSPDMYGHYRVAQLTQIKHHWWWKTNMIFDGILKRYNLDTYVVFLEEDHYVAPDFLHVLSILIKQQPELCKDCKIISLGAYLKNFNSYRTDINRLGVHYWFSSKHNMGMAFNNTVWNEIRECAKFFCSLDDYNWDWSLLQVSVKCLKAKMRVIVTKSPRVIHIGECGTHTRHCDNFHKMINAANALFQQVSDVLFPQSMVISESSKRMLKPSKPNGGWGDARDHELCLMNTYPTEHGRFRPMALLNYSSLLPPFDRRFNKTTRNGDNDVMDDFRLKK